MDETCAADLSTGVVHRPPGHPDAWTTFPAFSDTSHVHSVPTYRGRPFGKRCTVRMAESGCCLIYSARSMRTQGSGLAHLAFDLSDYNYWCCYP